MNNVEHYTRKPKEKETAIETEAVLAPDLKDDEEFQSIKNEWKLNYQLMLEKENLKKSPLERKEWIEKEMKKTNDLINEIKRDFPEFSDNHKDIIKYKAKLRALYELLYL